MSIHYTTTHLCVRTMSFYYLTYSYIQYKHIFKHKSIENIYTQFWKNDSGLLARHIDIHTRACTLTEC